MWLAWWDGDSQSFGVIVQEVREETRVQPKTLDAHSLDTHTLACPRPQGGFMQHWLDFCPRLFSPPGGFRQ